MKNNEIITIIIVVAILLFLFSLFGMFGANSYGMMGSGFNFMWIFGWIFMTLIIISLVLFIFWLIKQLQNPRGKR